MPSLYEGFGLPLVEAMSFGVPVVASNVSSLPEIVGDSGILVDPTNVSSIKDGVELLMINKKLRNSLSKNAFQRSQLFSWSNASKETIDVFVKAFNNNK
jgi:glycosyltransferase involved in cell wall biosynthesis